MSDDFTSTLRTRATQLIVDHDCRRVALVGFTDTALLIRAHLAGLGLHARLLGIFDPDNAQDGVHALNELESCAPDLVIVCADADKERLLDAARRVLGTSSVLPRVALAGVGHLAFRDQLFAQLDAPALVPSYATGSAHTRVHLYQCLKAAAAAGLTGAIVEFGAFKGGTTAWLARTARALGLRASPVIGFDTWQGFPERRSLLDLYEHPRCVFTDLDAVRAYTDPLAIELVPGDIAETYRRLEGETLLLCFFDTDNYSPTRTALELCADQLAPGGALVFDHVATTGEYVDTVGERMAAYEVLEPRGYLHLHGTGVFTKLR